MDNIISNYYFKIPSFNVSRETCNEFESLISMIQQKNKEINIISKKMFKKEDIIERIFSKYIKSIIKVIIRYLRDDYRVYLEIFKNLSYSLLF